CGFCTQSWPGIRRCSSCRAAPGVQLLHFEQETQGVADVVDANLRGVRGTPNAAEGEARVCHAKRVVLSEDQQVQETARFVAGLFVAASARRVADGLREPPRLRDAFAEKGGLETWAIFMQLDHERPGRTMLPIERPVGHLENEFCDARLGHKV